MYLQQQWATEAINYVFIPADNNYLEKKLGKYFLVAESKDEIIGFIYGIAHKAEYIYVSLNNMIIVEIPEKSGLIINNGTVKNISFIKKFTL